MSPMMDDRVDRFTESITSAFPHIFSNPSTLPTSLDPFTITTSTGFLPLRPPQVELPQIFAPLTTLLEDLPIVKIDGTPGLLATYQLGPAIDHHCVLPDLTAEIDKLVAADGKPDLAAVTAAFRDYAFLASAYLLEPCWQRWNEGLEGYGLGRQVLPKEIAGSLVKSAAILDIPPFMSYAAAYTLYNYRFSDPSVGTTSYTNLRLIRAFERGLDPSSSEAGFVLTHVDMVKHSPSLILGTTSLLSAISSSHQHPSPSSSTTTAAVHSALTLLLSTMSSIEASMEAMWTHSRPADYLSYRTFIFGITNQSMFPSGVVYAGHNDNSPMSFRGESGANDSIIPLLDALLEIPMPANPLTEILKDFRSYRPKPHREFLAYVREKARESGVREYCTSRRPSTSPSHSSSEDANSPTADETSAATTTTVLYLRLLDTVRSFRWRHWLFAREYIIRRSKHPTATGGSPIVTWLPNQLVAVMELMGSVWAGMGEEGRREAGELKGVVEMMDAVEVQRGKLRREVERWCKERGV